MHLASLRLDARAFPKWLVVTCVGALLSIRAWGQVADRAISLEEAVRVARSNAPAIAAARARVVQAEGKKLVEAVPPDPEIQFGVSRGRPRDGGPAARRIEPRGPAVSSVAPRRPRTSSTG